MSQTTRYCYSLDGERFQESDSSTREGAADEARYELLSDCEPGDIVTVYVGEKSSATEILGKDLATVGGETCDRLEEWLAYEIGWDDRIVSLKQEEKAELGKLIVDYIESKSGFKAWGVKNSQEHQVTVPDEEDATTQKGAA